MDVVWKTFRVGPNEGTWEPAGYNIRTEDGQEYGRWRRILRQHPHGLTVIARYRAPLAGRGPGCGGLKGRLLHLQGICSKNSREGLQQAADGFAQDRPNSWSLLR